jgi:hypothetical protein
MANVDEDDVFGAIGFGKIGFGDPVTQSGGSGIVDEAKDIKASDASSIDDGPSLNVGVPDRDGQNDVGYADLELVGGNVSESSKVSTDELGGGELLRLTKVFNLSTDSSADIGQSHVRKGLFDILNLWIEGGSSD